MADEELKVVGWVKKSKTGKAILVESGDKIMGFIAVSTLERLLGDEIKSAPIKKGADKKQ